MESYDLVLVMPAHELRTKDKIVGSIRRRDVTPLSLSIVVFYQQEATDLLKNSDCFLCDVLHKGVLLYSSNKKKLSNNAVSLPGGVDHAEAEQQWTEWMNKATQNIAFANQCYAKRNYQQAVGLLYIAALEISIALVRSHTGYEVSTFKLDQLLRLCDNFCPIRTRVFPANTPEEQTLLDILNSRGRYANKRWHLLRPTKDTCGTLLMRIDTMFTLATDYYLAKKEAATTTGGLAINGNGLLTLEHK